MQTLKISWFKADQPQEFDSFINRMLRLPHSSTEYFSCHYGVSWVLYIQEYLVVYDWNIWVPLNYSPIDKIPVCNTRERTVFLTCGYGSWVFTYDVVYLRRHNWRNEKFIGCCVVSKCLRCDQNIPGPSCDRIELQAINPAYLLFTHRGLHERYSCSFTARWVGSHDNAVGILTKIWSVRPSNLSSISC